MSIETHNSALTETQLQWSPCRAYRVLWVLAMLALCYCSAVPCAELLVAQIAPRTGPDGQLADDYDAGARLYFASINAQGGINGATIVLEARDDGNDPALRRQHVMELIARKPIAFIGAVGTASVESVLPMLQASNIALLGPLWGATDVDQTGNGTVFHIRPNQRQEIEAIVRRLDALGLKRIAVCYEHWPDTADTELWSRLQKQRHQVEVHNCGGDATLVDGAVNTLIAKGTQAVLFLGQVDGAAAFIQTMRARRGFPMIVLPSSTDARRLAAMLPETARRWVAVADGFADFGLDGWSADSIAQEFSRFRSASSSRVPSSRASLAGFTSAKLLVEALRRSGDKPTAAAVLASLRAMKRYDGGEISFRFSGQEPAFSAQTQLGRLDRRGAGLN